MYLPPYIIFHHFYIKVHQFTSWIWPWERKIQTNRRLGEILGKQAKMANFSPMHSVTDSMHSAFSRPVLEGFPKSKSGVEYLIGKLGESTSWDNLKFLIWSPFSPPKMQSPKTASCVKKKWQRGHFLGVFGPFGGPELVKISQPFLSMHKFSCWFQKFKIFWELKPPSKA